MLNITTSVQNGQKAWRLRTKNPQIHIIQTNDKELFDKVYNECLEAENNLEKILKIKNKYNPPRKEEDKYIYKYGNKYTIIKKRKYYGSYNSKEEAILAKQEFIKNSWDEKSITYTRKRWKWKNRSDNIKYIYPTYGNKFFIMKNNNYYGTYNTLEIAIEERDLLIKYNWDYQSMIEGEGVLNE